MISKLNIAMLRYLSNELLENIGVEKLYEVDGLSFHAFPERWYDAIPWGTVLDDIGSGQKTFNPVAFPKSEIGIGEGLMRFGVVLG